MLSAQKKKISQNQSSVLQLVLHKQGICFCDIGDEQNGKARSVATDAKNVNWKQIYIKMEQENL